MPLDLNLYICREETAEIRLHPSNEKSCVGCGVCVCAYKQEAVQGHIPEAKTLKEGVYCRANEGCGLGGGVA